MRKLFFLTIFFYLISNYCFSQNVDSLVHELTKNSIAAMESGDAKLGIKYGEEALELTLEFKVDADSILGNIFSILGYAYLDDYQYEKSLEYFEQSLETRICLYGEVSQAVVKSYNSLGFCYGSMSFYNRAILNFQKAINLFNIIDKDNNSPLLGILYKNVSSVYSLIGDAKKATLYAKMGLAINIQNYTSFHIEVAKDYLNLGTYYSALKDSKKAFDFFHQVMSIADSLKIAKDHPLMINLYSSIGYEHREMKSYDLAIENYNEQLIKSISRYGRNHPFVATAYNDIASVYLKMISENYSENNFKLARKNYTKALRISMKQFGKLDPEVKRIYSELGELYYNKGMLNKAMDYLERAKKSMTSKENEMEEELLYAESYLYLYNLEAKIKHDLFNKTKDINYLHQANEAIQNTLKLMDRIKRNFKEKISKQLLLENNYSIFEKGIEINFQLWEEDKDSSYLYEAFRLSEKSKSNLLLEAFHKSKAENLAGIPDSLLDLERSLKNNITLYEKLLYQEEQNSELDQKKINYVNDKIFNLKDNYEKLISKFEQEYPEYYKLKYDIKILTVKEIQKQVLDQAEGVLEYFVGDSSIYVFIIDSQDFLAFEIKNDFDLENIVKDFYSSVSYYSIFNRSTLDSLEMAYVENAYLLYQKIFEPFINYIPPRVIIIPDGVLAHIPFDALLAEKPLMNSSFRTHDYLLNEYIISYSYSAGLLLKRKRKNESQQKGTILAFAPEFKSKQLRPLTEQGSLDLKPLKFNIPEAQEIHAMTDGELFIKEEATEENFINEAEYYNVLHLATHGMANDTLIEYSYLAFTEIIDSIENELLLLKDIYNLKLNADMVVLSACQTGIGDVFKGEGMMSMSRAFSYAGADCIIPSLWSINDAKTKELMQLFYKNIQDGKPKDVAMQKAKIAYVKSNFDIGAHPFYWSPFVIIGNNSPVKFPRKKKETNSKIPLIVGMIGMGTWLAKKKGLLKFWPIKEAS